MSLFGQMTGDLFVGFPLPRELEDRLLDLPARREA
jgi:hypothetical protein